MSVGFFIKWIREKLGFQLLLNHGQQLLKLTERERSIQNFVSGIQKKNDGEKQILLNKSTKKIIDKKKKRTKFTNGVKQKKFRSTFNRDNTCH